MENIKIQIVEDNLIIGEGLSNDLESLGYEVISLSVNSEEAIKNFKNETPDLLLMDIELKGSSLNGIELVELFKRKVNVPIIYISGTIDSDTLQSAKATDPKAFLVKPYNLSQLKITIDLALSSLNSKSELKAHKRNGISERNRFQESNDFFFVKNGSKHIKIDINDIIYVKAESPGNNVQIFNKSGKVFFSVGIKSFLYQVHHKDLVRVNRSYLINLRSLQSFNKGCVFLEHNDEIYEIPIGRVYRESLMSNITTLKSD